MQTHRKLLAVALIAFVSAGTSPAGDLQYSYEDVGIDTPKQPAAEASEHKEKHDYAGKAAWSVGGMVYDALEDETAPECYPQKDDCKGIAVWGLTGIRWFPIGTRVAPNGVDFDPLFSCDLDMNVGCTSCDRWYLFFKGRFWGQKPGHGITNGDQGNFDFSKREIDFDIGLAWNYCGNWELRGFAYSSNNINRGIWLDRPFGFKDGTAIENRYYLSSGYARPVETQYDVARTSFVSVGYMPTKELVGGDGNAFKPGAYGRAYLVCDLYGEKCYLYGDGQLIGDRDFQAHLINIDVGVASRPCSKCRALEFRTGNESMFDLRIQNTHALWYVAARVVF